MGGVNVQLLSFLTLAMGRGEWSDSCPRYFNVETDRERNYVSHALKAGWPPEPVWTQRKVSCPCWGSNHDSSVAQSMVWSMYWIQYAY